MTQTNKIILKKTEEFVRNKLQSEATGHDWWHVDRVRNLAMHIADAEGEVDMLVIELAALLHDVADHKFHNGDHDIGPKIAAEHLRSEGLDPSQIKHVIDCMRVCSYSKGLQPETVEAAIVQDADRLDALGAIGIARLFATGTHFGQILYSPEEPRETQVTSVGHIYQKLYKLSSLMNTETGKKVADEREMFIQEYLDRFYTEWNGLK